MIEQELYYVGIRKISESIYNEDDSFYVEAAGIEEAVELANKYIKSKFPKYTIYKINYWGKCIKSNNICN